MILSMTGYGKAVGEYRGKTITADIKSLNGKASDVRIKSPNNYRNKEIEIRSLTMEMANRGKLDLNISVSSVNGDDEFGLNAALFKKYFMELRKVEEEMAYQASDLFSAILRIPNVIAAEEKEIDEEEWEVVRATIVSALKELEKFRRKEGAAMAKDLISNIEIIIQRMGQIKPYEEERIDKLKERMRKNLEEFLGSDNVDKNRFEQEVSFYIEKIDINEEKVRLKQHCDYFMEVIQSEEEVIGKKLAFISQEIGREINTLGSKAQDSHIQQYVVQMKEALEQIKEQIANVV